MELACDVLAHYPAPLRGTVTPLGNHGGFSGARLFRIEAPGSTMCLRAWPPDVSADGLAFVHALMTRATDAGLTFVPRILTTTSGKPGVFAADSFWDLTTWMPGTPSLRQPDPEHVRAACAALARIHLAWAELQPRQAPCPAVERRLEVYRDWLALATSGWHPPTDPLDPVSPWAQRAWAVLCNRLPELPRVLTRWQTHPLPLQPCLCDVWYEHLLFTGEHVTGLVDFGSCKLDHVAVDLARLLGSLPDFSAAHWVAGLSAYEAVRPLSVFDAALAADLQLTGRAVAIANWLRWLYRDGRTFDDRAAVARRLAGLVARLE